jgi:hypothetical protein
VGVLPDHIGMGGVLEGFPSNKGINDQTFKKQYSQILLENQGI